MKVKWGHLAASPAGEGFTSRAGEGEGDKVDLGSGGAGLGAESEGVTKDLYS